MGQISAVGVKRILYADTSVVTKDITADVAKTLIKAAITAKAEVMNVHGETWNIEESEASVSGHKNQLNGQTYRYDTTPGEVTPAFSIGQYDYATKAALMGGEAIKKGGSGADKDNIVGWKRSTEKVVINKALFCLTEDDVWFIYPNCQIVARESNTDKAIAIAVKGLVQTPKVAGVSSEYNFDEAEVKALV
ncbi:hypothetical protein [Bacteroides pyogenes]|uniref:hypothetical protein n=1 Tax=Bacteroides pyogenes TaxID=310300 RepID=UPI003FA18F0E